MRFVPSTPNGSLLLSALEETSDSHDTALAQDILAKAAEVIEAREAGKTPDQPTTEHQIVQVLAEWTDAHLADDPQKASVHQAELEAKSGAHPFAFAKAQDLLRRRGHDRPPYDGTYYRPWDPNDASQKDFGKVKHHLKNDAKIGFYGDWGTGGEDAWHLFYEMMKHEPDVLLHLGDIYNTGNHYDIKHKFLEPMDEVCRHLGVSRPPVLTIPGNHEYFTKAKSYFHMLDTLNSAHGSEWLQEASFFCLRTADHKWQFIGSDTGLQSYTKRHGHGAGAGKTVPGFEDSELEWHRKRISEFPGRTVFLSHHQVVSPDFSMYSGPASGASGNYTYWNPNLVEAFACHMPSGSANPNKTYLEAIDLWLWGHDHWFVPFVDNVTVPTFGQTPAGAKLRRGRLLGGSARETKATRTVAPAFAGLVAKDDKGDPALPDNTPKSQLYNAICNHTYGILDLSTGLLNHYQTPAWYDGTKQPPQTRTLKNPILTDKF
ncbi:metallophosphoesterase family protein [Tateyamaria sp.]|uniref:metallophosphoesterase family protein n=1 Tax=Tateyamaria sp. TaxID=1929288 RepID=UPI003B21C5D9